MKNAIQVSITTPCSENFDNFSVTQKGGFCGSCQKEVIDFTRMSTNEIMEHLKNNTKNNCGRFTQQQLNQPILKAINRKTWFNRAAIFGISIFTLGAVTTAEAQQIANKTTEIETIVNKTRQQQQLIAKSYTVKGKVLDDQNLPLPGVNVILKGTAEGLTTAMDGSFEFPRPLEVGDTLVFSYIGFDSKEYTVIAAESEIIDITIQFEATDIILMGDVAVEGVYSSKKNIFQKFIGLFK